MKKLTGLAVFLVVLALPSCATSHAVRWAWDRNSAYTESDSEVEGAALHTIFGIPVLAASVAWDAATLPFQAIFGVWPLWGDSSLHMKPADTVDMDL